MRRRSADLTRRSTTISPDIGADTLVLELPIQPPDVEVPVIELFLEE